MTTTGYNPAGELHRRSSTRPAATLWSWSELLAVGVLSVVPFLWRIAAGVSSSPPGDAWAYERIFDTFQRTGRVVLVGWNDITLVGMLPVTKAWVNVVGYGPHQLHLLGAVMCAVGLLGVRHLLVSAGVRHRLLALAVLGLCYGFVVVSGTYLSDPFYFAGGIWAVALAVRLVSLPHPAAAHAVAYSVGAALSAVYAFSIRQHAVAVVAAVLVLLWRGRARLPQACWLFGAVFVTVAAPMYIWRRGLDYGGNVTIEMRPRSAAAGLIAMWFTVGILALPYTTRLRRARPITPALVALTLVPPAALLGAAVIEGPPSIETSKSLIGDLAALGVPVGLTLAVAGGLAAAWSWLVLLTTPASGDDFASRLRPMVVTMVVIEAMSTLVTGGYFPRYTLVSGAVLVCALAVRTEVAAPRPYARTWNIALAATVAVGSLWSLDSSVAPVHAIEQAAAVAECAGIRADQLDAGLAWNGLHSAHPVDSSGDTAVSDDGLPATRTHRMFTGIDRRAVVVDDPPSAESGLAVVGPFHSNGTLPGTGVDMWIVAGAEMRAPLNRCAAYAYRTRSTADG